VVKNFHFRGLQERIAPLAMFLMAEDFRYLTLNISMEHYQDVLDFIKETHQRLFPEHIYETFFLDKDFEQQYFAEERTGNIMAVFTMLGIFIACIGLFGLASFMAESRTKEIGIRKVMGASVAKIVVSFSLDFIKWVIWACVIALPLAWFSINWWLQNFAYRVETELWIYAISMLAAVLIALFSVIWQAFQAARSNPVDSLRYE